MFFGKKFFGYQGKTLSGLDILVLSIIKNKSDEKGISGYKLIKEINKLFGDMWKVSAGTIYPLLQRLDSKDFVEIIETVEKNRNIKYYKITVSGKEKLTSILDNKLEGNFLKVLDYVKTVISGIPITFKQKFEDMCSCFPYHHKRHGFTIDEDMNNENISTLNLNKIDFQIKRLEKRKEHMNVEIEKIEMRIKQLKEIRVKLEKNMKTIEISDDEEDF